MVTDIKQFTTFMDTARNLGRLLFLCALVGVIAGLGAILFFWMLDLCKYIFLDLAAGYRPAGPGGEESVFGPSATSFKRWLLFLLPAAGGILSGFLVYTFAPEAEGHGTDAAIESYHYKGGEVRARVPIIKAIASAITIGSGGSGGREGPIAQIGSGFGSMLADWLRLRTKDRRILMAAGMGAGIGAIFHAPLAGALFAAEVLYREMDIEYEVIIPATISSIIAYSVFAMKFGWNPLFLTPNFVFESPQELVPYFILALVLAGAAAVYVHSFYGVAGVFRRLKVPRHLKPAIGGLVVGAIGFMVPQTLSTGYGVVQQAFTGQLSVLLLFAIAIGKIATTSFSIGSGGSGGVFGPAVVIGGALGGAVGLLAEQFMPGMVANPGSFVIVGMAGFFAAAANTPISTIIMVSEMTGNYHLLMPTMWVCIIAYLLVRRSSIYEKQVSTRIDAPAHLGEMMGELLKRISVADALKRSVKPEVITVHEGAGLKLLLEKFSQSERDSFPIVDKEGKLVGIVSANELRRVIGETGLEDLVIAKDIAMTPPTITPTETLFSAVRKMMLSGHEELVVVADADKQRVVGTLSRSQIVATYDSRFLEAEKFDARKGSPPTAGLERFFGNNNKS
jgi:CIC family chloride channel protein